jgi:4-diphosphocytidyl-2-C-methyl-D-erythritol kinase
MLSFPNCKINLGLHVTRRRDDGYHDLETVFYPLPLKDALEIIRGTGDTVQFNQTGLAIAGDSDSNLCVRAWQLLKKDFPELPGINMHLHKTISIGAGLGGGSADGAFALALLNRLFQLGIDPTRLESYALQLGSDCPFFIRNRPTLATGRGEVMTDVELDLSAYSFVMVNPGIHVSTAEAFKGITPRQPARSIRDIVQLPVEEWKQAGLTNDFEAPVCNQYPVISAIKKSLYAAGASYASMTGSGSSVYGIFPRSTQCPVAIDGYPTTIVG